MNPPAQPTASPSPMKFNDLFKPVTMPPELVEAALAMGESRSTQRQRDLLFNGSPLRVLAAEVRRLQEQARKEEDVGMKFAAIMTATVENTRASVLRRITQGHPYWTVAYGDVCCAVDREIMQRERADKAEAALAAYREVLVMIKRDLDTSRDDHDTLILPRACWDEAIRRIEAIGQMPEPQPAPVPPPPTPAPADDPHRKFVDLLQEIDRSFVNNPTPLAANTLLRLMTFAYASAHGVK